MALRRSMMALHLAPQRYGSAGPDFQPTRHHASATTAAAIPAWPSLPIVSIIRRATRDSSAYKRPRLHVQTHGSVR